MAPSRIAGSPFTWLRFDAAGAIEPGGAAALSRVLTPEVTDLAIISHGWKTDEPEAFRLYEAIWTHVRSKWPAQGRDGAGFAVAGVSWQSKTFRTDFDSRLARSPDRVTGPNAGIIDLSEEELSRSISEFGELVSDQAAARVRAAAARACAEGISGLAGDAFADEARMSLDFYKPDDAELAADRRPFRSRPGRELLLSLAFPPPTTASVGVASALGTSSRVGGLLAGPRSAIARFLNQVSFFEMKARAGCVGVGLGGRLLAGLQPHHAIRLHLLGHSFGARLVTSAAEAMPLRPGLDLRSLTMLQGAFSHNALSASFKSKVLGGAGVGAFPGVVGKVSGPISITHTHNDEACTLAYAFASRLSRDNAAAVGDRTDDFGAMGANGAQNLPSTTLLPMPALGPATGYAFCPGKVHNANADACISDHMDIANNQVCRFVATALVA